MADRGVNATSIVRNTMVNSAGGVVTAALAVILTPVFLREFGPDQYGLWLIGTVFTVSQGLGLADLGLRQTGVRFVAQSLGRSDEEGVHRTTATLLVILVMTGAIIAVALVALVDSFVSWFSVGDQLAHTARLMFTLVAIQLPIDLAAGAFLAVIEGTQRYGLLRIADVGGRAVWGIASVSIAVLGGDVVDVAIASLVIAVASLIYSIIVAHHVLPGLRTHPRLITRTGTGELLRYGSGFTVMRIAGVVYAQMDRIILGSAIAAAAVARYDVPYKIHALAALVLSLVPSAILPASAFLQATDDQSKLRELYLRGSRYAVATCTPIALAALIYAKPLVQTWVDPQYWSLVGEARIFLLFPLFVSFHVIGGTMLAGLGRMRILATLGVSAILLNLILSLILVGPYGIKGVIIATQISYAAAWIPNLVVSLQVFDVSLAVWWQRVLRPNLIAPVVQVAVGLATLSLVEDLNSFPLVALAVVINAGISVAVFGLVVIGRDERRSLLATLTPGTS